MKKNIFVGSIIAVAILILVSFTSVIGYTTIKSDSISSSPLFNVRTNRAIGEQSTVIHRQYINKGISLWFPTQDEKTIVAQEIVDGIRRMDEQSFEKFITVVIMSLQKDKRFNDVNFRQIRDALYLLRNSDESVMQFNIEIDYDFPLQTIASNCFTFAICPLTIGLPNCVTVSLCEVTVGFGIKGMLLCIAFFPLFILFWMAFLYNIIKNKLTIDCHYP